MKKILKVDNPNVYAEYVGAPLLHPQLALISYDEVSPLRSSMNNYGVYGLFIQKQFPLSPQTRLKIKHLQNYTRCYTLFWSNIVLFFVLSHISAHMYWDTEDSYFIFSKSISTRPG